ncbi:MAG: cyclic nucleotide-binding domain-containing protein [Pseudomonadota bacterium]
MGTPYSIVIVGSGPAGLAAAARAAELGLSHVLLEAEAHLSHTIHRYQKGKHVMAEPSALPLRASLPFAAGKRETILQSWDEGTAKLKVKVRHGAAVTAISGTRGAFTLTLADGEAVQAECVVLAIGLQGNPRKLGCEGEDCELVQYQLDDPDEYRRETIVIVGAGDAAIENALALSTQNSVIIVNRRDDFDRAREGNRDAILKAIEQGRIRVVNNAGVASVVMSGAQRGVITLSTPQGAAPINCQRVIARLGATPPRAFIESCGIVFPSKDPNAVPAVSEHYESNVPGLYVIGALAGFPLIKQAMNQGWEVVEFIAGRNPDPADTPLLAKKFEKLPGKATVAETIERIRSRIPILSHLTPLQLREFLLDSELRTPRAGEMVFERNDYSDSFYSILDGGVFIAPKPDDVSELIPLEAGQFFGEMSLISGRRRSATVLAGEDCVLVETPRRSMNKLIASVAAVKRLLDETFLTRAIQSKIAPGLSAEDLQEVVSSASVERFKAGEILFSAGDVGDGLHLIRKGSVTVAQDIGGKETVLAYVPAGQYVGEMALLTGAARSATVKAAIATETIKLAAQPFLALLGRHPSLRNEIGATLQARAAANARAPQGKGQQQGIVQFLMQQGIGEATDVLLIDETLCIGCDHCEKACGDTHGGISRLDRKAGASFAELHVPTSCRHCEHPHCMKDCPPDAIRRAPNGEVFISDACIGCGNCEKNCPYGVIQMGVVSEKPPSLVSWLLFGGTEPGMRHDKALAKAKKTSGKQAVKCDMCKDLSGGPACVRACPTGAAIRVSPEEFIQISQGSV